MHRIVVNVQTGEVTQVELTAEEIAAAEAQYAAWIAEQPDRGIFTVPVQDDVNI
jgi:hypothetical protein